MADAVGSAADMAKGFLPKLKIFGAGTVNIIAWIVIAVIILVLFGIIIFFVIRAMKFNKKIVIFEEINGQFQPTRKDRATQIKLSTSGDTIFYTLKSKKYLPTPTYQTGSRTYWYFIRADDEWINFRPTDLNQESKKMGAMFLDKEMRYARTQIQRGLKERYDKPGFWQQYGLLIMGIGYIAIIGIMTFLLFDKWIDLAGVTNSGVETAGLVMDKVEAILGKLDNVCGSSGIRSG